MSDAPRDEDHDWLTGLYNYRYGMRALADMLELKSPESPAPPVGIILADIFQLKTPHNNYGHPPVDEALYKVGQVFQQQLLPQEIACRYGGDEFLLIIPHTDIQELQERAEQIRQAANKIHVYVNEQPREKIRLSVGVALWPLEARLYPYPTALRGVESLMYFAEQDLQRARNLYVQEDLL